ncbi:hypothetical protein V8F33_011320 [Rhypophila sp. PSN 637]
MMMMSMMPVMPVMSAGSRSKDGIRTSGTANAVAKTSASVAIAIAVRATILHHDWTWMGAVSAVAPVYGPVLAVALAAEGS